MNNIWNKLPQPFFVLAPMEAVTDVVFRHVVAKAAAPDVYFTEFTNATGWVRAGERAIGGRLIKTKDEKPIIAQLWGADPESMAKLAAHCKELGYDGIDLNCGCPDASAVKSGSGAGLIKNPELTRQLIEAAKTSGLPVSLKTRLGYSRVDEYKEWLSFVLSLDLANLTIHLRTKKEMSKVPAHHELISDIKKLRDEIAPQTLLTVNGDIKDRAHGMKIVDDTGVDGIMIGRGIFANPFAFAKEEIRHTEHGIREETGKIDTTPASCLTTRDPRDLIALLHYHLSLYDRYGEQTARPFDTLKRFFKIYIRDFEGAAELRDRLMHAKSTSDVRAILD